MKQLRTASILATTLMFGLTACGGGATTTDAEDIQQVESALHGGRRDGGSPKFTVFAFTSQTSTGGQYTDGDVRLESITGDGETWDRDDLQTVRRATILVDDGVDATNGGHNLASGQGIESVPDRWAPQGPATVTPTSHDIAQSLGNFNLTSIVVTRENVGTASVEVRFDEPATTFFFWERGSKTSPTGANSDVLVEALDARGHVIASYKLLRSEYVDSGIAITTWNGAFSSPTTPTGTPPELGAAGLLLDTPVERLRLTSVQQGPGGTNDDGPDYKVIAAKPRRRGHHH